MTARQTDQINILLVDDRTENLNVLDSLLQSLIVNHRLNILRATSGNEALGLMIEYELALVLLDVQMPDMDGFETAELMKASERTKHIPIIFVTAINKEQENLLRGYETGAVDYLFKPIVPEILTSKVNVFLELHQQKKSLQAKSEELRLTVEELKKANKQILKQQKMVIEEERLKVLLQMAGATAHEINQPLTYMLNHINLIEVGEGNQGELSENLSKIKEAGHRIVKVVKKMQSIPQQRIKPLVGNANTVALDQPIAILSIEDSDSDFNKLESSLKPSGPISLVRATTLDQALEILSERTFKLIFLDYVLPDGNGLNFMRMLAQKEIETPVVVITGQGDEMIASQIIQAGVYDYLPKDRVSAESISRIIFNTLEKVRLRKEVEEAHKKLSEMSIRDELTKLYNRRYFMESLSRSMAESSRDKTELMLCMADLDHFKQINDTYGHVAGDMVLSTVGQLLGDSFRQYDLICRYGGEELAIILPNTDVHGAKAVCERFREIMAERTFVHNEQSFNVTVSIGIAPFDHSPSTKPGELVAMADEALYHAKRDGRNRTVVNPMS